MPKAASKPRKLTYRVTNWSKYNESLVNRGDITFWFDEAVIDVWEHENDQKKNGRPFTYSDVAIETLLTIRELFRLPYRQTEGFGRALARLMRAEVAIPDYTSLQKRAAKLKVSISIGETNGPIDLVVDSTGLKVYGEGEWKMKMHGVGKRRTWRKIHLAVDPDSHTIVAQVMTGADTHDGDAVEPLLEQVEAEVKTFYGDGAWKESIGYHRRSLAETAMFRLKAIFGDRLKNRMFANQATEAALRYKLLNAFVALGMPLFAWS